MTGRSRGRVWILLGAAIGVLIALQALDPAFIRGTGGKWVRPENDLIAYLVGWNYFVQDPWRFPVFSIPGMGYPEGGSVLFNDALPLTALPTKLLYQLFGLKLNPFGWWIFLTYVMQGALAARVMRSVGVTSVWAAAAAAVFATVNIAFGARFGHTALSSHFLVLWAVTLHFESLRSRRATVVEWTVLLALTLLVNSYLFVMVFALELATLLALWFRQQLSFVDARASAVGAMLVALVGVCAGYGAFLIDPTTMKSQGFGLYSWNLLGLLLPPDGLFGWLEGVPRAGTHGQYEGESYIGRGALLLLAAAVLLTPRKVLGYLRTYRVYCSTLALFAIYAASNLVYIGDVLLLSYELPPFANDLANYFRATGRFIWPLAYSLMLLPLACVFRWLPRPLAIVLATAGIYLQYVEGRPALEYRHVVTSQAYDDLIDTPRFDSWLSAHQRLWQYPSWWCGGLAGPDRVWGRPNANLELQTQLAAARRGVPTNSVYTSRALKDCDAETSWAASPAVVDGTLYLLSLEAARTEPLLAELARSHACTTLEWAVVCSKQWERIDAERARMVR